MLTSRASQTFRAKIAAGTSVAIFPKVAGFTTTGTGAVAGVSAAASRLLCLRGRRQAMTGIIAASHANTVTTTFAAEAVGTKAA